MVVHLYYVSFVVLYYVIRMQMALDLALTDWHLKKLCFALAQNTLVMSTVAVLNLHKLGLSKTEPVCIVT